MIIFSSSLKRIFKNKIRFILLMLCPFIFITMFAFQNHRAATIGIVDKDNSTISKEIYTLLKNTEGIKLISLSEDEIYDLAASYVIDYAVILDEGFQKAILEGKDPVIKEYYVEDRQKIYFVKNSMQSRLDSYKLLAKASEYDNVRFEKAIQTYGDSGLSVQTNLHDLNRVEKTRTSLGFLIQFMLYMAVITCGIILEDKSSGTYYRTFYGPISIKRYMTENLAAFYTTALIQSLGIISALVLIFRIYLGNIPLAIIGLFGIFSLVCIAMGLFTTTVMKKPIQAYVAVAVLTTPLIMIGGCYWSFDKMPDIMNKIGSFIPLSWVMRTVDAVLDGSITLNTLMINYGILLLFAAIFLAVGLVKKVDISK